MKKLCMFVWTSMKLSTCLCTRNYGMKKLSVDTAKVSLSPVSQWQLLLPTVLILNISEIFSIIPSEIRYLNYRNDTVSFIVGTHICVQRRDYYVSLDRMFIPHISNVKVSYSELLPRFDVQRLFKSRKIGRRDDYVSIKISLLSSKGYHLHTKIIVLIMDGTLIIQVNR